MKTYVNRINGNKYLYAYDTINIAEGKKIQKTRSLGRVEDLATAQEKKIVFSQFLIEQEIVERTKYWQENTRNPKFKKYVSIGSIEQKRTHLYRSKKEIGTIGSNLMERLFSIDFIYNSNKLEGSKVPLSKVQEQVENPASEVSEEPRNTLKALNYVNSEAFEFKLKNIIELHSILLAHESRKSGLRKETVVVFDSPVADWKDIEIEMGKLLTWYKTNKRSMYPPELAFDFYYRFERIHPFIDGNGRTGRLIMNRILKDHLYHPIIVWNKNHQAHKKAFSKRMEGRDEYFYKFMADQFTKTHKIYLSKLSKAVNADALVRSFYTPSSD